MFEFQYLIFLECEQRLQRVQSQFSEEYMKTVIHAKMFRTLKIGVSRLSCKKRTPFFYVFSKIFPFQNKWWNVEKYWSFWLCYSLKVLKLDFHSEKDTFICYFILLGLTFYLWRRRLMGRGRDMKMHVTLWSCLKFPCYFER